MKSSSKIYWVLLLFFLLLMGKLFYGIYQKSEILASAPSLLSEYRQELPENAS